MINLRYHIVSIVAVFLALGIGVALGSTFVDGFVVGTLRRNVDILESERNDLRNELQQQRELLAAQQEERAILEANALPLIGGRRLEDVPVLVIAVEGVDPARVETLRVAILGAAARFDGVVWLTPRLDLTDPQNRADLARVFGLADDGENLVRRALQNRLLRALFPEPPPPESQLLGEVLADITGDLVESTDSLSVPGPDAQVPTRGVLEMLRDGGFIEFDGDLTATGSLDGLAEFGTRFYIVDDADGELDPEDLILPLMRSAVELENTSPMVAFEPEPSSENDNPVFFVGPIRSDELLSTRVATVDHGSTFAGHLAALVALDRGEVGHYGSDPTAERLLPAP
ncbi:MAG TPA: hypothetical protein ENI86_18505 [Acidimicrobiales bacterium]|nr:hypothetical protein [Acidimicrobiales bacterium]